MLKWITVPCFYFHFCNVLNRTLQVFSFDQTIKKAQNAEANNHRGLYSYYIQFVSQNSVVSSPQMQFRFSAFSIWQDDEQWGELAEYKELSSTF